LTVTGPVNISGNLTVTGTQTIVNSNIVSVGDSIITLNGDITNVTAPTENAGIDVNRGSSANVQFLWDETNDRWTTNSQPLAVSNLIASGFANVAGTLNVYANSSLRGTTSFIAPLGNTITMTMLDSDVLSFAGGTGQLFSIADTMSGVIFSVNDISGIPSIEVYDTGNIRLAEFGGNVAIASTNSSYKLYTNGPTFFAQSINLEDISVKDAAASTTTSTTQFALVSASASVYGSMDIMIQATQGTSRHLTRLAVSSNATIVSATEYASIITNSALFTTEVDLSGGNMRVLITPASASSTTFKASYELITA
jgi:hypothetical protein